MKLKHPDKLKQIAKNIAEQRKSLGWSQKMLADQADIERRVLQRLEYFEGGATVDTLISISLALKVPIKDLFKGIPDLE